VRPQAIRQLLATSASPSPVTQLASGPRYQCGGPKVWSERFTFTTAPTVGAASLPYVFGLTGDLGQTNDSDTNVRHFSEDADIDSILHVGDLSYADSQMIRWDTWGRMVEPVAARIPWMVT